MSASANPLHADFAPDGSFEGYASLFNRPDLGGDIVLPGAFHDSLRQRGARGIRMLYQHDPAEPVGAWTDITEDARGLFVRGRLATDVKRAREILALMRAGALDGLSIGFRAVSARRDAKAGSRRLYKIDLWEISIVTFPLLPGARVTQVKACGTPSLESSIVAATRLLAAAVPRPMSSR